MTKEENLREETLEQDIIDAAEPEAVAAEDADVEAPELSPEELAQLLIDMGKEKEESEARYLRMQADFDNYRKRTQREKEDFLKQANAGLFRQLLPIIDNLERACAFDDSADTASVLEGVRKILKQFCVIMAMNNVELVKSVGEDFDPNVHEAVVHEEAGAENSGKVTAELQKGYLMNGKLLRPAMVKVGK